MEIFRLEISSDLTKYIWLSASREWLKPFRIWRSRANLEKKFRFYIYLFWENAAVRVVL